jgi:hypothetical protein
MAVLIDMKIILTHKDDYGGFLTTLAVRGDSQGILTVTGGGSFIT